jgi:hypothetical protein
MSLFGDYYYEFNEANELLERGLKRLKAEGNIEDGIAYATSALSYALKSAIRNTDK